MDVNERNYRIAMAEAYARALNNSPECIPDVDREITHFTTLAMSSDTMVTVLRRRMISRLGGSSAFKSIPKLFTEG